MRTITIEGVEHKLDCNALTPFYYSEQFLVNRGGRMVAEDINDAISATYAGMTVSGVPPMLKMQQLFWAFEKTANPEIPGFKEWAASLPVSTLALNAEHGWAEVVTDMVTEYWFPETPGADVGADAVGEAAAGATA